MLRLRRVRFRLCFCVSDIACIGHFLPKALDVPESLTIRSESLKHALVGATIDVQNGLCPRLRGEPVADPVEVFLLVT